MSSPPQLELWTEETVPCFSTKHTEEHDRPVIAFSSSYALAPSPQVGICILHSTNCKWKSFFLAFPSHYTSIPNTVFQPKSNMKNRLMLHFVCLDLFCFRFEKKSRISNVEVCSEYNVLQSILVYPFASLP